MAQTGNVAKQTQKAQETGEQAQRTGEKALKTGEAAAGEAAANKKRIAELERELRDANAQIATLQKEQKKTSQTIERLESKSGDG